MSRSNTSKSVNYQQHQERGQQVWQGRDALATANRLRKLLLGHQAVWQQLCSSDKPCTSREIIPMSPPLLLPQEQAPLACSRLLVQEHCEGPSLKLGAVELVNGVRGCLLAGETHSAPALQQHHTDTAHETAASAANQQGHGECERLECERLEYRL